MNDTVKETLVVEKDTVIPVGDECDLPEFLRRGGDKKDGGTKPADVTDEKTKV